MGTQSFIVAALAMCHIASPGQVAGLTQINFRVSADPVIVVFVGGWFANYFTVWVKGS